MGVLRAQEAKITAENTFNRDHFWMEGNHESKKRQNFLLGSFADSSADP